MAIKWNEEQVTAIKGAVEHPMVLMDASAGAGKSTLLFEQARLLIGQGLKGLLLSFNSDIAKENKKRAKGLGLELEVRTFHSYGLKTFPNKFKMKFDKVWQLVRGRYDYAIAGKLTYVLGQLRGRGIHAESVAQLKSELANDAYRCLGQQDTSAWIRHADKLIELMADLDKDKKNIDFDDMCRLPLKYGWITKACVPDFVLVDEYQDLNPDQRNMLVRMKTIRPDVRIIMAGDRKQAIYGFRGAAGAAEHLEDTLEPQVYQLSTTWRCAKHIVNWVNDQVEASEMIAHRKGGVVDTLHGDENDPYALDYALANKVNMIIGSRNSTLITIWCELFDRGVDGSLKGSGIVAGLRSVIRQVGTYNWSTFVSEINAIASSGKRSSSVDQHSDMAVAVRELIKRMGIRSKHELFQVLDDMELTKSDLMLETVWSAKGREADVTLVISDWWSPEQRNNVRYVAFTRARNHLIVVKPMK